MTNPSYPQSEKLSGLHDQYIAAHEFLDHLNSEGISLGHYLDIGYSDKTFVPVGEQHELIVLRWLGIDPVALEHERRAMLAALR